MALNPGVTFHLFRGTRIFACSNKGQKLGVPKNSTVVQCAMKKSNVRCSGVVLCHCLTHSYNQTERDEVSSQLQVSFCCKKKCFLWNLDYIYILYVCAYIVSRVPPAQSPGENTFNIVKNCTHVLEAFMESRCVLPEYQHCPVQTMPFLFLQGIWLGCARVNRAPRWGCAVSMSDLVAEWVLQAFFGGGKAESACRYKRFS